MKRVLNRRACFRGTGLLSPAGRGVRDAPGCQYCRHCGVAFWHQKLGSLGYDLGASIRGFKKAMGEEDNAQAQPQKEQAQSMQLNTEALSHAGQDAKSRETLQR